MASKKCNRLVFEAVYESSVSKLQLVISTFPAVKVLAGFAECNGNGEHLLVVAIKKKNITFIDELVTFLQSQFVRHSRHPTTSLIDLEAFNQLADQIPIIELIDLLVIKLPWFMVNLDIEWLEFLAQVFSKSTSFTRKDKIIALELIGALLLNIRFDQYTSSSVAQLGLQWWRQAMTLRYFPADGEPLLPKIPDVSVPSMSSSVVFGSAVEVSSIEELDLLLGQLQVLDFSSPSNVRLTWKKQMQRQALLVTRRVTSQSNREHPYRLYLELLLNFGINLELDNLQNLEYSADNNLIINTHLLILEQATGFNPTVLSRKSTDVFISTLNSMSGYFIDMLDKPLDSPGSRELSYANFIPPTKFFCTIAKFFAEPATILNGSRHDLENVVFRFAIVLESISPRLSSQEQQQLEEFYSNYIRDLFPKRTTTVLHAAIRERFEMPYFRGRNVLPVIKLLLKLGADPNAINTNGQTPLHILAGIEEIHLDDNVALLFQALVDAGTHLDMAANNGDTILSILKKNLMRHRERLLIGHPYYDRERLLIRYSYYESLLHTVFPLSCYCARVIRRHGIRFDEDRVPLHLQAFISLHSAKEAPPVPAVPADSSPAGPRRSTRLAAKKP